MQDQGKKKKKVENRMESSFVAGAMKRRAIRKTAEVRGIKKRIERSPAKILKGARVEASVRGERKNAFKAIYTKMREDSQGTKKENIKETKGQKEALVLLSGIKKELQTVMMTEAGGKKDLNLANMADRVLGIIDKLPLFSQKRFDAINLHSEIIFAASERAEGEMRRDFHSSQADRIQAEMRVIESNETRDEGALVVLRGMLMDVNTAIDEEQEIITDIESGVKLKIAA